MLQNNALKKTLLPYRKEERKSRREGRKKRKGGHKEEGRGERRQRARKGRILFL